MHIFYNHEKAMYPKEINGVSRSIPMSFEEADSGMVNPRQPVFANRLNPRGYYENCQSCVVAFEARLRGYNVCADRYDKLQKRKKEAAENFCSCWICENKKAPAYITADSIADEYQLYSYIDKLIIEGQRYTLKIRNKNAACMHVVCADKVDGKLRIFDPQVGIKNWYSKKAVLTAKEEIINQFHKYDLDYKPEMFRIDDKGFNMRIVKHLLVKGENNELHDNGKNGN